MASMLTIDDRDAACEANDEGDHFNRSWTMQIRQMSLLKHFVRYADCPLPRARGSARLIVGIAIAIIGDGDMSRAASSPLLPKLPFLAAAAA
jgi:hypothetical protein